LIIGGYAVIKYTEPRYTKDIDLWIRANSENAKAVYKALSEFGAPLEELSAEDFAHEGFFYQMGVAPVRVDILMSITALDFGEAWSHRVEVDFEGIPTFFISRKDLIISKKATGRPQDLIDVELLEQVEEKNDKEEE
jgi:hypothetical protein